VIDRAVPSVGRRELEYMRDWCEAYGEKPGVDSRHEMKLGISNKDLYIVCVNAFTVLCVHMSHRPTQPPMLSGQCTCGVRCRAGPSVCSVWVQRVRVSALGL